MSVTTHDKNARIQYVPIGQLKPALYNPRTHDAESAKQLRTSIERFGMVDPIIVNSAPKRKNVVIGGHFRLRVAKDIGYKTISVQPTLVGHLKRSRTKNGLSTDS